MQEHTFLQNLLKTVDQLVNPASLCFLTESDSDYENFSILLMKWS